MDSALAAFAAPRSDYGEKRRGGEPCLFHDGRAWRAFPAKRAERPRSRGFAMTDALHSAEDRLRAIADMQPPFAHLLGARIVRATRDLVTAELVVREELTNRNGGLHGGAVMAVADNLGGTAAFLNLPEGAGTTTIESKTNFFAAVALGDTILAECTPLHRGRTTMVWQTRITRSDGKLAAIVTQTQLVTMHPMGGPKE